MQSPPSSSHPQPDHGSSSRISFCVFLGSIGLQTWPPDEGNITAIERVLITQFLPPARASLQHPVTRVKQCQTRAVEPPRRIVHPACSSQHQRQLRHQLQYQLQRDPTSPLLFEASRDIWLFELDVSRTPRYTRLRLDLSCTHSLTRRVVPQSPLNLPHFMASPAFRR